ncbi:MAG TPA: hypothetical protein PLJ21_09385 [Pseudobdellovibrionaceae bacterium]|mgnify:CR=1 FL=1|nr:hypothetical protein [Pseudobdellovibrionaceae bacterium]
MRKLFSNKFMVILILIASVHIPQFAKASGILDSGCIALNGVQHLPMTYKAYPMVNAETCQKIEKFNHAAKAISIGIIPIGAVALVPGVKQALYKSILDVGILLGSSPAIATISIMTGTGLFIAYVVLQATILECQTMKSEHLKQEILEDLYKKYGVFPANHNIPLKINDGII